jgi:hypothetical protein
MHYVQYCAIVTLSFRLSPAKLQRSTTASGEETSTKWLGVRGAGQDPYLDYWVGGLVARPVPALGKAGGSWQEFGGGGCADTLISPDGLAPSVA